MKAVVLDRRVRPATDRSRYRSRGDQHTWRSARRRRHFGSHLEVPAAQNAHGSASAAGATRLVPQAQVLVVRLPPGGLWLYWARPTAVAIEHGEGVTQRISIHGRRRTTRLMTEQAQPTSAPVESADPRVVQVFDRIFGAARASAVYSAPVTVGAYTVITASEVSGGGGFGAGHGFGPAAPAGATGADAAHGAAAGGGGSGGGGGAIGRPVAVIVIGPDGVQVKPIFDVTKVGLVFLTTSAAILVTLLRVRRAGRLRR
jgi:uncharacterized spore protein YtfJ